MSIPKSFKKGFALIEVMLALALSAALMPALITSFFAARGGSTQDELRLMAISHNRTSREVVRLLKDADWQNVAANGTYHPNFSGGVWSLAAGAETNLDATFTRQIVIADAYRDGTGALAQAGTLDPSTKHVTSTVSWGTPFLRSDTISYYISRLKNLTHLETTVADFTPGSQTGTTITNTAGGEVTLGSGGAALSDWCSPSLTMASLDLPKNGVANAISAIAGAGASPNQVITGTGDNSSGVSLGYAQVTNANPPSPSLSGTFDGYKTNGVFVTTNYAFIATDNNSREVVIIDLNNYDPVTGKYALAGYFNVPGNGNGGSVYAVGNIGFVTSGSTLYSFSLTGLPNTGSSRSQLSSISLGGTGAKINGVGSTLFVAESSGARPLEIISFDSNGILSSVGYATISGQNGIDVALTSTASRAYLATSQGKVYILNTNAPYSGNLPTPLGVYDTNGMTPKGVTVVTNNKVIVVGTGGTLQYQVVDISNEGSPSLCTNSGTSSGGLTISSGVKGVASVHEEDGDAFSYIITGDSGAELKIIQGGPGGGGGVYASSGTFESAAFNPGLSVVFNRFDVTSTMPVDTNIRYQVASSVKVNGTCDEAIYSFVGPDLTAATYFSSSAQIPLGNSGTYHNPGECFKYRAYLTTTNTNNAPYLSDILLNYSP